MKKVSIFFFVAICIFFSINSADAAVCNPQCVYSGRCAENMEFLPGSSCGSARAPGILCQERGCTPAGTTTPETTSNQCTSDVGTCRSACQSGETRNTSKTCAGDGLICCSRNTTGGNNDGSNPTTGNVSAGTPVTITVTNPLRYDTVEGVLTSIMNGIKGIVVTLAILMIVIGGIMYIFSLGNPDNMKRAKNVIIAALVGLAIVIAAPAFLREISVLLGWNNAPAIEGGTDLTLTQIARNILNFLLSIIGILALIMMIVSGIMYLTSAGNETRMKQARGIFTASLIGIAVAMASLVLVTAVARFFT